MYTRVMQYQVCGFIVGLPHRQEYVVLLAAHQQGEMFRTFWGMLRHFDFISYIKYTCTSYIQTHVRMGTCSPMQYVQSHWRVWNRSVKLSSCSDATQRACSILARDYRNTQPIHESYNNAARWGNWLSYNWSESRLSTPPFLAFSLFSPA